MRVSLLNNNLSIKQITIIEGYGGHQHNTEQIGNLTPLTQTVMLAYSELTPNKIESVEIYFLHERNLPLYVEVPNDVKLKFKH